MPKLTSLKPQVQSAFIGIKAGKDRQATRALNTGSKAWRTRRAAVLKRDHYQCRGWPAGEHADGCDGLASEVDHIDGDSSNDAADGSNYQSLSKPCHSRKTAKEMGR